LKDLELNGSDFEIKRRAHRTPTPPTDQAVLPGLAEPHPLIDALHAIRVDELSPMEAMMKLYELQRLARDG